MLFLMSFGLLLGNFFNLKTDSTKSLFFFIKKTIFLKILRYIKVIYIFVPYLIKKIIK